MWIAAVPLGIAAKLEMNGSQLFINCARSGRDYRLLFTEKDDVERMGQFCQSCKSSSIGDLRSLLSFSESSSTLSRSLDVRPFVFLLMPFAGLFRLDTQEYSPLRFNSSNRATP